MMLFVFPLAVKAQVVKVLQQELTGSYEYEYDGNGNVTSRRWHSEDAVEREEKDSMRIFIGYEPYEDMVTVKVCGADSTSSSVLKVYELSSNSVVARDEFSDDTYVLGFGSQRNGYYVIEVSNCGETVEQKILKQ